MRFPNDLRRTTEVSAAEYSFLSFGRDAERLAKVDEDGSQWMPVSRAGDGRDVVPPDIAVDDSVPM